ncbi:hypothetical protein HMI56_004465 [Coelomomyces lativittatus]|nr:hypothetical protein HMI56_004465 [Coelomomyces lativittatus]
MSPIHSFFMENAEVTQPLDLVEPINILEDDEDFFAASKYSFVTNQWKHHSPLGKNLNSNERDVKSPFFFYSTSTLQDSPPQKKFPPQSLSPQKFASKNISTSTAPEVFSTEAQVPSRNDIEIQSLVTSTPKKSSLTTASPSKLKPAVSSHKKHPFHSASEPTFSSKVTTSPVLSSQPTLPITVDTPSSSNSLPIQSKKSPLKPKLSSPLISTNASTHEIQVLQEKLQNVTQELNAKNTSLVHLQALVDELKVAYETHQRHLESKEIMIQDLQQRLQSLEGVLHEQQSVRQSAKSTQDQEVQVSSWNARKREKLKRKLHALMEQRLQKLLEAKMKQTPRELQKPTKQMVSSTPQKGPPTSMPFVVGTNTGKSYSLPANLQKMMKLVQTHRQCEICVDEPTPKAMVAAHLESEQKRLEKEYAKIRKEYSEALHVYDGATLENKLIMHSILKELAGIMASKAEELAALTQAKASAITKSTPQRKLGKKIKPVESTAKNLGLLRSSQRVQSVLQGRGQ